MEAAQQPWPALGVLLVRDGLVSKEELETILEEQRDERHKRISGHQLGELLVARGTVTPTQVAKLVAEQYELPFIELELTEIDLRAARVLDEEIARRLSAIPISHRTDGSYVVAIADPATVLFSDELRRALGSATHFAVVGPEAIEAALTFVHDRSGAPPQTTEVPVVTTDAPDDDDWQGVVIELRSEDSTPTPTRDHDSDSDIDTVTHRRPPLGALLQREGLVTDEQLEQALAQQSLSTSWRLGEILVARGVVTAAVVARIIAEQYELPYTELDELHIEPHVAALLPREIAREFPAVPISAHPDGSLEVAIADPTDVYYSDELHNALGVPLTFVVASPDAIEALIEAAHTPVAIVDLDTEIEDTPSESLEAFDRADSVESEDAQQAAGESEALPEFVPEPEGLLEFPEFPEFVVEQVAVEEPVALEEPAVGGEPKAEETFEWNPVWSTEVQVTDDVHDLAEQDEHQVDEAEAVGTEDLTTALLSQVSESRELAEPAPDAEHDTPLALVEADEAGVPAEAPDAGEAVEREPPLALIEVEHTSQRSEATAFGARTDDEAEVEAPVTHVEAGQPARPTELEPGDEWTRSELAFVDSDRFDATPQPIESVQVEELDGEHPAAYADDLDAAIEEVLALGASAIHFSPQGEWHTVRARIDGLVRELGVVAKGDLESLVERVGASAEMRVDVVATKQGDKVILFPREQAGAPRVLAELGLTSEAADTIHSALSSPSGATVVCGPIGSGTTTTLYAALGALNTSDRVVSSIEDPVERVLDGIDQTEVDPATGFTFADGLRTLLGTDSDVILVGEIRDRETAGVALQAALDGRHILAGLRAPSAAAAIRRLADMGLDYSVLGGALTCVVAQRLVRRICTACRETYYASDFELTELGQPTEGGSPRLLARGRGCTSCDGTGFRGRVGLFEILTVTEEVRALVYDGASAKKIHRAAVAAGMQTLRDDGIRLCLDGITTAAEVQRILGADR